MSLQTRVLGSIALLLVLALLGSSAFLLQHARSVARLEVHTAFRGAEEAVRDIMKGNVAHTVTLREVVASFEGQRHVRAALVNEDGRVIIASRIATLSNPAPAWFVSLMSPPPLSVTIPIELPQFPCVVELTSDPSSELAQLWEYALNAFVTMLLFCAGVMGVVWLAFSYALRHLTHLQAGMLEVAKGRYHARMDPAGAPEFADLARGFNHMAARLEEFSGSNRQLEQQVRQVQDEERTGIARDLHDEVGPYLFAIQVDASMLAKAPDEETRNRGNVIREAVLHVQRQVKDILRQLRPANAVEFGLGAAVADLVAFWSRRYPAIRFEHNVAADLGLERRGEEAAYRIVQEGLSNAVRHGDPHAIRVAITRRPDGVEVRVEDDGGGLKHSSNGLGHMGLAGLEERVLALHGRFAVENLSGQGVRIVALLPHARALEVA
jgi:two-component system, NarL family, sensor histidine kinase UhpB